MKNALYTGLLIILLTLFSCKKESPKVQEDTTPPITITTNTISSQAHTPFLSLSGKIEAVNNANISTRMMGYVNKIYVKTGTKVKKGQRLLTINNADLSAKRAQVQAKITEATASVNSAKRDFYRFTTLFKQNSVSQKELENSTTQYTMAKARLNATVQMKNEVSAQFIYTNIKAPFSGVITNQFIKEGMMANPGVPLLAIESPNKYQIVVGVPESEISKIKNNAVVNAYIKSLQLKITGKVTEVSSSAANTGGQYLVKIVIDKANKKIRTGMYTTVQFPVAVNTTNTDIVLIPRKTLIKRGQLCGIYTISNDNRAVLRWLRLGRIYGDNVEVLSGLKTNETYISSAESKLFNGAKVTIQ